MLNKKNVEVNIKKEDGSEEVVKIFVVRPTNNSIKNADRYRAKIWNQCILDGVLTKKELVKFLKDRNVWNEKKENEEKEIINKIQSLEKELYLGTGHDGKKIKLSDGQKIAIEMRSLRLELRNLISEKISFEENTAEALADNAKFDYFVSDCTFYENGDKVYNDIEDYNSKSTDEVAYAAATALAEMMYKIDSRFEETLPENKWLKRFNLVNDDLSLVNKNGELVDIDGRKINKDGYYLNDNGELIDRDGNLIEEDGTYVIQADYDINDEEDSEETKTKKKRTKT